MIELSWCLVLKKLVLTPMYQRAIWLVQSHELDTDQNFKVFSFENINLSQVCLRTVVTGMSVLSMQRTHPMTSSSR